MLLRCHLNGKPGCPKPCAIVGQQWITKGCSPNFGLGNADSHLRTLKEMYFQNANSTTATLHDNSAAMTAHQAWLPHQIHRSIRCQDALAKAGRVVGRQTGEDPSRMGQQHGWYLVPFPAIVYYSEVDPAWITRITSWILNVLLGIWLILYQLTKSVRMGISWVLVVSCDHCHYYCCWSYPNY